jgi:hypothetical protein
VAKEEAKSGSVTLEVMMSCPGGFDQRLMAVKADVRSEGPGN